MVIAVAAAFSGPANPVAAAGSCPGGAEWELLGLVNQFRAANGRPALTLSAELVVKAQAWSDQLAAENYLHHSNLADGVSPGWSGIAENVAYNFSVAANETGLEGSAGHRANLLGNYSELGLGVSCGTNGRIFVSQVFVRRATPTPAYQAAVSAGAYSPVNPTRLLDTRAQIGYSGAKPVAATKLTIPVAGAAGIPASGVTAAVVTVSAIDGDGVGWLQVGPAGSTAFGAASNLNFSPTNPTASATTIVQLGAGGAIDLFIAVGAHAVIDVTGYFGLATGPVSAGRTIPIAPVRALDTRPGYAPAYGGARPTPGVPVGVAVTGIGDVPAFGVAAVVANITTVGGDTPGYLVVGPADGSRGGVELARTSRAQQVNANLVIVPVDALGRIVVTPAMGTDILVDVFGWITDSSQPAATAGLYVATTPIRFLDTRAANGIATTRPISGTIAVDVSGRYFYPGCARAVFGNITVVSPQQAIWLQAGPKNRYAVGTFSNLNDDVAGSVVANSALIPVGDSCDISIFASTATHEVLDLSGYFL